MSSSMPFTTTRETKNKRLEKLFMLAGANIAPIRKDQLACSVASSPKTPTATSSTYLMSATAASISLRISAEASTSPMSPARGFDLISKFVANLGDLDLADLGSLHLTNHDAINLVDVYAANV